MDKRIKTSGQSCWLWSGCTNPNGYGMVTIGNNHTRTVHGLMYFLFYGQVPRGLELHHKCRNKLCVNPDHLEVVDDRGHVEAHPESMGRRTHCVRGHEFSPENTYIRKDGGRGCRQCNNERVKKWYEKNSIKHRERVPSEQKEEVADDRLWDDRVEVPLEEVELDKRDRDMYAGRQAFRKKKAGVPAKKEDPFLKDGSKEEYEEAMRLLAQIKEIKTRSRGVKVPGFEA